MNFCLLNAALVDALHDAALNPGELPGRAVNKSLDRALARVDSSLVYGLIADAFDVAASYPVAISQGRCYNDGNRPTAFRAMDAAVVMNGISLDLDTVTIGQIIIRTAQRQLDAAELGLWLRTGA